MYTAKKNTIFIPYPYSIAVATRSVKHMGMICYWVSHLEMSHQL